MSTGPAVEAERSREKQRREQWRNRAASLAPIFLQNTVTMMKLLFASLLASASAFVPAGQGSSSSALKEFAGGMVGGEGPEVRNLAV